MKIIVDINHPAHVHYFKNFIWEMEKRGHKIMITASKKDISFNLLRNYGFEFIEFGSYGKSLLDKLVNIPILDYKMFKVVKAFHPDLFLGFGSIRNAHVSRILRKPCIALDDTEHAIWEHRLYVPFTDAILTPDCFMKDFGKKHIKYRGYTELTYLHPNYYTPDPSVLDEIGLDQEDAFIIVRFVSWQASHDIGQKGIKNKEQLVQELEKYGRVLITSEKGLPKNLEKYGISVSPEKFHDLLSYSTLCVGEGGTVASEAAVLGVHSIFISTLGKYCGVFSDQARYGLQFICESDNDALMIAKELLENKQLKMIGKVKQKIMLKEKIDVTGYLINFIENYPASLNNTK